MSLAFDHIAVSARTARRRVAGLTPPLASVAAISAAPVSTASAAGPAGNLAFEPKNCTGTPLLPRSRSPIRATSAPLRRLSAARSARALARSTIFTRGRVGSASSSLATDKTTPLPI